jgi:hypothetical protein
VPSLNKIAPDSLCRTDGLSSRLRAVKETWPPYNVKCILGMVYDLHTGISE